MTRKAWLLAFLLLAGATGALVWTQRSAADRPAASAPAPVAPVGIGALGRVEPASRIRKLNQPGGMAVTRLARLDVAGGEQVGDADGPGEADQDDEDGS